MTLDPNDARLTAYAFGELDAREAALVEAELGQSPEAARALVEIRRTAELLREALRTEPARSPAAAELNAAARAKIYAAAEGTNGQHAASGQMVASHVTASHAVSPASLVAPRKRMSGWLRQHKVAVGLVAVAVCITGAALVPTVQTAREAARRDTSLALVDGSGTPSPSPYYLQDDVNYFPPNSEYSLRQEHAKSKDAKRSGKELGYTVVKPQYDGNRQPGHELRDQGGSAQQSSPESAPVVGDYAAAYKPQGPVVNNQAQYVAPAGAGHSSDRPNKERKPGDGDSNGKPMASPYMALPMGSVQPATPLSSKTGETTLNDIDRESGRKKADERRGGEWYQRKLSLAEQQLTDLNGAPAREADSGKQPGGRGEDKWGHRYQIDSFDAGGPNSEDYAQIVENQFQAVGDQPLSTFSIDVDTGSYSNVRRFLNQGALPPPAAVRTEELINYFHYSYAPPKEDAVDPFAAHADVVACPWAPTHRLVRIGIKGREIAVDKRPACNLVFLIDVSGSMNQPNKLPLVKEGLRMLVEKLGENDSVAIVVYAGASGMVLPATNGTQKHTILTAIDKLEPGGSTNGAAGIQLAYETAIGGFIKGGANRVILATDGDFNVGMTDQGQLVNLIEEKAKSGVFLSVLGFGMGNLKDSTLEKLSDKGNGNYAYIDGAAEARKVLVEQLSGTLVTIAKDVKIQIEFNPAKVLAYRLIGYENRMLAKEDFNDDKKDAGEIGAGHTVTALYEVVPVGAQVASVAANVDPLEYQDPPPAPPKAEETKPMPGAEAPAAAGPGPGQKSKAQDLLMLKLRYKAPDGDTSKLLKYPVQDNTQSIGAAGDDCELAAAVAAFGMQLRHSSFKGSTNYAMILELAESAVGEDKEGYRREFVELVKKAQGLGR